MVLGKEEAIRHNGVACVVNLLTGLPIDYEVLSNFCIKCQVRNDNLPTQAEYDEWREKHSPDCPKSFNGTANAVKVVCFTHMEKVC